MCTRALLWTQAKFSETDWEVEAAFRSFSLVHPTSRAANAAAEQVGESKHPIDEVYVYAAPLHMNSRFWATP